MTTALWALLLLIALMAIASALWLARARRQLTAVAVAAERRRHEALRAAEQARRRMLAGVSLELKSPLTAMRGYLETLQMDNVELDVETRERYLRTVERETVRLDRLVDDLQDLARLENGVGPLNERMFAVERVFEHVISRHELETCAREIHVRMRVADEADQVVADPDRIEQAVEHLFAHALRHTPAGGHIELRAQGEGDAITLSVVDSGAAMAAGPQDEGLGLSIAKAIVERHHGSIAVRSAPGGTAFTIVLPHQWAGPRHHSTSTNL